MRKIANTNELQTELRHLLVYTQSERPSRGKLARDLKSLATRLAGILDEGEIDPRECVQRAVKQTRNEAAKHWLEFDEHGAWEKDARELLEWLRHRNPDALINQREEVIGQIADKLSLRALQAILDTEKKRSRL